MPVNKCGVKRVRKERMRNSCHCRFPDELCDYCQRAERHIDELYRRSLEVAQILIGRGRDDEYADRVAARFVEIEFRRSLEWN